MRFSAAFIASLLLIPLILCPSVCRAGDEVTFNTSDGYVIHADYLEGRKGAPVVILLHQLGSDRTEFRPLADRLNGLGMNVLVPDARGHGESVKKDGVRMTWMGFDDHDYENMVLDIAAEVGYMDGELGLGGNPLGIVGASIQSSTALVYSAGHDRVAALALLSPGLRYRGIDTLKPMESYAGRPVFMAAATGDPRSLEAVEALMPLAGPEAVRRIVEGAAHGVGMFRIDPELEDELVAWLSASLNDKAGGSVGTGEERK